MRITKKKLDLIPKFGELYELAEAKDNLGRISGGYLFIKDSYAFGIAQNVFRCSAIIFKEKHERDSGVLVVLEKKSSAELLIVVDPKDVARKNIYDPLYFDEAFLKYNVEPDEWMRRAYSEADICGILKQYKGYSVKQRHFLPGYSIISALHEGKIRLNSFPSDSEVKLIQEFSLKQNNLKKLLREIVSGYANLSGRENENLYDEHLTSMYQIAMKLLSEKIMAPSNFWKSFRGWKLGGKYVIIDGSNIISQEILDSAEKILKDEISVAKIANDLGVSSLAFEAFKSRELKLNGNNSDFSVFQTNHKLSHEVLRDFFTKWHSLAISDIYFEVDALSDHYFIWTLNYEIGQGNYKFNCTLAAGYISRRESLIWFFLRSILKVAFYPFFSLRKLFRLFF